MEEERPPAGTPPTIYDVARRAGVSISTVSLALNAPSRVRPSTSARVHQAIRELGFVPKVEAAVRAQRGTGRIGVVGRFSAVASANERLQGVLTAAAQDGYEVIVYDHGSATFHPHLLDSLSLSRKLDGVILIDLPIAQSLVERLERDRFPTVLVEYPRRGLSCVHIDNPAGGRLVAQYLAQRGHRHCAFLGLSVEPDPSLGFPALDELRLQGFREGLAEMGIELPAQNVQRAPILWSSREAESENYRVAKVGFDDCDFAAFLGLTTVRQHLSESGRMAFQLVRDGIGAREASVAKSVTLPLQLIARHTA